MIEKTQSFKTGDGKIFGTIEEAQANELETLWVVSDFNLSAAEIVPTVAAQILKKKAAVMDILTMTASSRPKARKSNGATKKRQAKPAEAAPAAAA